MLLRITRLGVPLGDIERITDGTFGIPRPETLRIVGPLVPAPFSSALDDVRAAGRNVSPEVLDEIDVYDEHGESVPARVTSLTFSTRTPEEAMVVLEIDASHAVVAALLPLIRRGGGYERPEA
jgi:hypothetical protein